MGMKTLYFKEHEGIAQNPVGHLSAAAPSMPSWWNVLGSHTAYVDSQLKTMSVDQQPTAGDQVVTATDQGQGGLLDKEIPTEFNIFPGSPGDGKSINEEQKSLPAQSFFSVQATLAAQFDIGYGQPMICAKHPPVDQYYGIFSAYGPQVPGRIMLPMDMSTDEGPIYVNAKQYHGILRRRKSRAKAELENKASRARKQYMHHSRHLHAMRRPRGSGGRFLTKQEIDKMAKDQGNNFQLSKPAGSQSSGGLQSDSGSANSSKERNGAGGGLNLSGRSSSEVTSMFSREDMVGCFQIKTPPPFHSFPGMMNTGGHGFVMPSKWVAAVVDNCSSNLKV
ncbi:unnamed protein product [Linum tenue]|nr:unnamed protein product [Linum tenue]